MRGSGAVVPEKVVSRRGHLLSAVSAGGVFSICYVAAVSVILAGLNSRIFSTTDLLKVTLGLSVWFALWGAAAGLIVGLVSLPLARRAKEGRAERIPRRVFFIAYLFHIGFFVAVEPYILDAFASPPNIPVSLLFSAAVLAGTLTLFLRTFRPARGLTATMCVLMGALTLIVVPLSLSRRNVEMNPAQDLLKPTRCRVILLGLDGIDWRIADQLIAEGGMPNLQSLIQEGSRARLATFRPTKSPYIWTTITTGKSPDEHGINIFVTKTIPFTRVHENHLVVPSDLWMNTTMEFFFLDWTDERDLPITNSARLEKALWNIFGEQGIKSGIINWWATWPAEAVPGLMVSDRVLYYRKMVKKSMPPPSTGLTHPPELLGEIGPWLFSPEMVSDETFRRYMDIWPEEIARMRSAEFRQHALESEFTLSVSMDESIRRVAPRLLESHPGISFWAIYTRGTDILSHAAMKYSVRVDNPGATQEEKRKYGRVIDEVYKDADRLVGEVKRFADPATVLIIVSDHGFAKQPNPKHSLFGHDFAPAGIVLIAGGPVLRGVKLRKPSVYDVTPTILYLMGMPVARDMPGRVWTEALDQGFLRANPFRAVDTYGPHVPVAPASYDERIEEVDERIKQDLRALGYIK